MLRSFPVLCSSLSRTENEKEHPFAVSRFPSQHLHVEMTCPVTSTVGPVLKTLSVWRGHCRDGVRREQFQKRQGFTKAGSPK